ncbi:hypothetical protein [Streptomyces sp. NBC_01508]|uniref:hypothetical protein n=1 Tax=Streptomyces sp. NBC_01508 TaxID=2903888 RepID=UPI003870541A
MLRHGIPPARFFSQVSNDIIRHPRLSSDAVRLLTWQLSLPLDAEESLSRSATRAGIKKGAFLRAKGQLKAEGYVHEWREQGVRGLWSTVQLVSSVPLSAPEAAALKDGRAPVAAPTVPCPAAGRPTGRAAGRHPENTPKGNTSNHPRRAAELTPPEPQSQPHPPQAREAVADLHLLDPRLRVPRGMLPQLAALAAQWLACGHTAEGVREEIHRDPPAAPQHIHSPGGLVRYILRDPRAVPVPTPAPEPRVARMRECEGERHIQPLLFRPLAEETSCPACRQERAESAEQVPRPRDGVTAGLHASYASPRSAKSALSQ